MKKTVETKTEEVLESIGPALKGDGGDVEFLRFNDEDGVVELCLLRCVRRLPHLHEDADRRDRTVPQERYSRYHGGLDGLKPQHSGESK